MSNILLVVSSPNGEASHSTDIAKRLVARLTAREPGAAVTVRDLAAEPLAHVGGAFVNGMATPPERRSDEQQAAIALSDALIDELIAADTVVIASAMVNFAPTSTLKAWIDHISRSGKTFRYSEAGVPEGLVTGKKVYLVLARGGVYSDGPLKVADFQEPYLRHTLGFLGMTDVEVIAVEGMAMGPEMTEKGVAAALDRVSAVMAEAA